MATEWTETMRGTFPAHVAEVEGFALSILGGDDLWCWRWLVSRGEDDLAEGTESTLAAAMAAAEDAARRLAGEDE